MHRTPFPSRLNSSHPCLTVSSPLLTLLQVHTGFWASILETRRAPYFVSCNAIREGLNVRNSHDVACTHHSVMPLRCHQQPKALHRTSVSLGVLAWSWFLLLSLWLGASHGMTDGEMKTLRYERSTLVWRFAHILTTSQSGDGADVLSWI